MNDDNAAFQQQLDKLRFGGELQIERDGIKINLSFCHGMYIAMTETSILCERLQEFLKYHQNAIQSDEQYILYEDHVFHCCLLTTVNLADIFGRIEKTIQLSAGYE